MTLPWPGKVELIQRLRKQWDQGRFLPLDSAPTRFPLDVPLVRPSSREMVDHFPALQAWIAQLSAMEKPGSIELTWQTINHRQLGRNTIPRSLVFADITALAGLLGVTKELRRFLDLSKKLVTQAPELEPWVSRVGLGVLQWEPDIERLVTLYLWIKDHPDNGLFLRELSLPGIDTKFVESHWSILDSWLSTSGVPADTSPPHMRGIRRFIHRYGFRQPPDLIRFRILDQTLLSCTGGWQDLTVPAQEFAARPLPVSRVFVCENDISALAFPALPGSIVVFGRGYDFTALSQAQWLGQCRLLYWGDIDTHGFAILNQFRQAFPQAESMLMDRQTLLRCEKSWGTEAKQTKADLPNLTPPERDLYRDLCTNALAPHLRLEQEYVPWRLVCEALKEM